MQRKGKVLISRTLLAQFSISGKGSSFLCLLSSLFMGLPTTSYENARTSFINWGWKIQVDQIETPSSLCRFNPQILCSDVNIKVKTKAQKLESQNQETVYPNHFSDSWGFLTSFFQMLVFNNNNNSSSYSINNNNNEVHY